MVMVLAVGAIFATTVAQAMLKYGMTRVGGVSPPGDGFVSSMRVALLEPYVFGGFLVIVAAIPMWLHVLSRLPLSVASPLVSIGYVLAVLIGAFILNESVPALRIFGVGLIVAGVVAVSFSR
jgi:multidrug transporter EmrE-like cation transporter